MTDNRRTKIPNAQNDEKDNEDDGIDHGNSRNNNNNNNNNNQHLSLHLDPIDDDDDDIHLTKTASVSTFDTQFFHQIVCDAGRWAYGVVMVEVWIMNERKTHLFRPIGGIYIDKLVHDYGTNDKFARLLDPNRDDFFTPLPFAPGIGLPGILYAEGREGNVALNNNNNHHHHPRHHPLLLSPFPNAVSPRHLPTLSRNRSRNNNSRSRSNRNMSGSKGSGSRRRGRRHHRRGNAMMNFDTIEKSGLYDEEDQQTNKQNTPNNDPRPGNGHNRRIELSTENIPTTKTHNRTNTKEQTNIPVVDTTTTLSGGAGEDPNDMAVERDTTQSGGGIDHHYRHGRNDTDDIEIGGEDGGNGEWNRSSSSSGRIFPGGAGERVKNAISNNLPIFNGNQQVIWRDLAAIADDPDQPFNPRIKYLQEDCGLGWVAGVPFHVGNTDGVCIYYARDTTDVEKLMDRTNEEYIAHASLVIGSAYAFRMPRLAAEKERRQESKETMVKVRKKIQSIRALDRNVETFIEEEAGKKDDRQQEEELEREMEDSMYDDDDWSQEGIAVCFLVENCLDYFMSKTRSTLRKSLGVQIQPPPASTWEESFYTFLASLITILVLTCINHSFMETYGSDYGLVLGPFGAMATLLFSLASAPASQPRNAILGQTISLLVAYGFGQTNIDQRLKRSLATATSIALMAKMGLTHPPAGASAMVFSVGSHSLVQVGMMLLGCVVAIILATLINNLDSKRQYPTSWGHLFGCFTDLFCYEYRRTSRDEKADPLIRSYIASTTPSSNTAKDVIKSDNVKEKNEKSQ